MSKLSAHVQDTEAQWFRLRILEWAKDNLRDFPWRATSDSYAIFVAEFLLQQTDAPRVLPVYQKLINQYPDIKTLASASLSDIQNILHPLGFHFRSKRLTEAAKKLVLNYNSKIPCNIEALLKLSGVGPYTAYSICANAYGKPYAVLDTNIGRIVQRFFSLKPECTRIHRDKHFWEFVQLLAPQNNVSHWNLSLIDFGALVCMAREPRCNNCPLKSKCHYAPL